MDRPPGRLELKRRASLPQLTKTGKRRGRPPKGESPKTKKAAGLRKVYVGSDGSGIGAAVLALESIPCLDDVVHEFASEENTLVRQVLTHNSRHIQHVYEDNLRDNKFACHTDLYFNLSPGPLPQERGMSVPVPPWWYPTLQHMRVTAQRAPRAVDHNLHWRAWHGIAGGVQQVRLHQRAFAGRD